MPSASYNPDASPESTSVDGMAMRISVNETWATIRAAAGNSSDDSGTTLICRLEATATTDQYGELRRVILLFDTSALPDAIIINSAKLRLYATGAGVGGLDDAAFYVVTSNPASNTAVANGDFDVADFGSTQLSDTGLKPSTISALAYNDWDLNAAGLAAISVDGITKLGLMIAADATNTAPTWSSGAQDRTDFQSSDDANPPILEITYTQIIHKIVDETLNVGEGSVTAPALLQVVNEAINFVESSLSLFGKLRIVTEVLNMVEAPVRQLGVFRVVTEALNMTEVSVQKVLIIIYKIMQATVRDTVTFFATVLGTERKL